MTDEDALLRLKGLRNEEGLSLTPSVFGAPLGHREYLRTLRFNAPHVILHRRKNQRSSYEFEAKCSQYRIKCNHV